MAGNICPKCGKQMEWKHHNGISVLECTCGYMVNVQTGKEYETFDFSKGKVEVGCPSCGKMLNFPAMSGVVDGTCPFCDHSFMIDTDRVQVWQKVNCPKCGEVNSLPPDALVGEFTCRHCDTPVALLNQQPNYRDKVFHVCPSCGTIMTTPPTDKMIDIRCHVCSTAWRFDGKSGDSAILGACSRCGHTEYIPFLGRYQPYICDNCGQETRMANPPLTPEERRWLHIVEHSEITKEYCRRLQAILTRPDIRVQFEQGTVTGYDIDFDARYLKLKPILADGTVSKKGAVFDSLTFSQVKRDLQRNLPPQQQNELFDAIGCIVAGIRFAEIIMRDAAKNVLFSADVPNFKLTYTGPKQQKAPNFTETAYARNNSYTPPKQPQMSADEKAWINKIEQSQITKVYGSKLEYLFGQSEFRRVFAKGNIMGYELRVLRTFMLLVPYFTYDTSAHDEQAMYLDYPFGTCAKELRDEADKASMPPFLRDKFFEHEYTAIPYESACDRFAEIMFKEHLSKFDYLDLDFANRMIYTKDAPPKVRVVNRKKSFDSAPPKQQTDVQKWMSRVENSFVIKALGDMVPGFFNDEGIKDTIRRENIVRLGFDADETRFKVTAFRADGSICESLDLFKDSPFSVMMREVRENMKAEGASPEAMAYFDVREIRNIPLRSAQVRAVEILMKDYFSKVPYLVMDPKRFTATVNLGGGQKSYNQQYSQPNYGQQNTYQPPQPKSDEERWVEKVEDSRVIEALGDMTVRYFNDDRIKNVIRQNNIVKLDLDCGPDGCQMMAVDASGKTTDILDLYEDYSYRQMRQMILNEMAKNGATPQQLVEFEKTEIANIPWKKAQLRVLDILLCDYLAKVPYVTVNPQDYTAQIHLNGTGGQQPQYQAPSYNQTYSQPQQPKQSYQAPQYSQPEQKKGFFSNVFSSIKQGVDNNKAAEEQECAMVEDNNMTWLSQMKIIDLMKDQSSMDIYHDPLFSGFRLKINRYGWVWTLIDDRGVEMDAKIDMKFEHLGEIHRKQFGDSFIDSCYTELYYSSSRKKLLEAIFEQINKLPYWNANPKSGYITKK